MKQSDIARVWKGFWQLADPKIWIASTVPMVIGGALAFSSTGRFDVYWFIVSLIGIYSIEIGKNAVNEVVDYFSGVDKFVTQDKRTPFSGGKKAIVDGKLTMLETLVIATTTIFVACYIGVYLMIYREPSIFWIGALGLFFSIFYSLPPLKFAYNGLGEFVVGLTFGPLVMSGIYVILTHSLNLYVIITSLPIGFIIANVLFINQFPDYEADLKGDKRNWVVRLGKEKSVKVYAMLYTFGYICLLIISVMFRNPFWLLGLLSIPLAVQAVKNAKENFDNIPLLITSNAKTVLVYQLMGVSMLIAAITNRFVSQGTVL